MPEIISSLVTLGLLVLLQAVLGFDNLLYISLESQRAPESEQSRVRKLGIGIAVGLRIVLLFVLINLVEALQDPFFTIASGGWVEGTFNFHSVIVLFGGVFILYTATKEIIHMMSLEEDGKSCRTEAQFIQESDWADCFYERDFFLRFHIECDGFGECER